MDINTLKDYGIDLGQYSVVGEREEGVMALDAAPITTPNAGVPVELLTFFDNRAIKVLTAKRAATEIFNEVKAGSRADLFDVDSSKALLPVYLLAGVDDLLFSVFLVFFGNFGHMIHLPQIYNYTV